MISIEMAKCLIDKNFFRMKREEETGILRNKLLHLSRMLLEKENGDTEMEGDKFSFYLAKEGLVFTEEGRAPQEFHNTACEEDGWSWFKITGPNHSSEYYYNEYFDRRKTDYFETSYFIYFDLFRWKSEEVAKRIVENLMRCDSINELKEKINELAVDVLDFEEMVNMIGWIQEEAGQEEPTDMSVCVKTMLLCAYYLYHRVNGTAMESNLLSWMNSNFCLCFPEEEIDAEEYMDCFLTVLEDTADCSQEGTLMVMDLLLNVHFSYAMDHHEKTPTLYFFRSNLLKEYKELREQCEEIELVSYLDKLVPLLEDPAFMFSGEAMDGFVLEAETCVVESGYTKEEYICCYYYYERQWRSEEEYVKFDYAFSIARKCFEVLYKELKRQKEVLQ